MSKAHSSLTILRYTLLPYKANIHYMHFNVALEHAIRSFTGIPTHMIYTIAKKDQLTPKAYDRERDAYFLQKTNNRKRNTTDGKAKQKNQKFK